VSVISGSVLIAKGERSKGVSTIATPWRCSSCREGQEVCAE